MKTHPKLKRSQNGGWCCIKMVKRCLKNLKKEQVGCLNKSYEIFINVTNSISKSFISYKYEQQ